MPRPSTPEEKSKITEALSTSRKLAVQGLATEDAKARPADRVLKLLVGEERADDTVLLGESRKAQVEHVDVKAVNGHGQAARRRQPGANPAKFSPGR